MAMVGEAVRTSVAGAQVGVFYEDPLTYLGYPTGLPDLCLPKIGLKQVWIISSEC